MHPYDHKVTQEKKDRLAKRMKIADPEYLVLSHSYMRRIKKRHGMEPEKHTSVKYQPLQLRWYSAGGRVQWLVPNCDVGGFPNLQWGHFGLPDTLFAPLASRAYADSAWTLADDLGYMVERYSGQAPIPREGMRGHLLVYWTYYMGRQSVRLARHVNKWRKHHGDGIDVRFVNADSLMMGLDHSEVGQ